MSSKYLYLKTVLALLCLTVKLGIAQGQADEQKIRETLYIYLEGRNNGDTALLSSAFHPTADLRYLKDTTYTIWPVKDYVAGFKPGQKINCISRIISIDILGNAAQAKIELEYPRRKYADYIHLLYVDNRWVITGKTFANQRIDSTKRILFVITSTDQMGHSGRKTGLYLSEVTHAYKPLVEAGFEIDFVSPKGGKSRMYGMDMNDSSNLWFVQNPTAYFRFTHALTPNEVIAEKYKAIYFVGEHGTMWDFPDNKQLMEITRKIYEGNGIVSGVCHGPAGLVNVKLSDGNYLVKGKTLTSFTNQEEKEGNDDATVPFLLQTVLKQHGAIFIEGLNCQKNVQVDGRLITGQNPASASGVAAAIIQLTK